VGAAYQALMEENKFTIGLLVHADDDRPNIENIATSLNINHMDAGDYSAEVNVEGDITGLGAVTVKEAYSQSPLFISADAIYNLGTMLEAGILFDYGMSDLNTKEEYTGFEAMGPGAPVDVDYKSSGRTEMAITPALQANIPAGEDLAILPGLYFTTAGSGTIESFALDPTTSDVNDTYKSSKTEISVSTFAIGCGLQAMAKKLQIGLQYESGSWTSETTPYAINGTAGTVSETEGSTSNIRAGAEFWVAPMFAVRAGYAMLSDVTKDGTVDSNGNPTDLTESTSRITFGAGLKMEDGLTADLLIQLDTKKDDPASDPEPDDTAMGVYGGVRIPI
jgi:hypothetical protein